MVNFDFNSDEAFAGVSQEQKEKLVDVGRKLLEILNTRYTILMVQSPCFVVFNNGMINYTGDNTGVSKAMSSKYSEVDLEEDAFIIATKVANDVISVAGNEKILYFLEYGFYPFKVKTENGIKDNIVLRFTT